MAMNRAKGKLGKKLARLNMRISAWDSTVASHKAGKFNPAAFKKPGSQKTHG